MEDGKCALLQRCVQENQNISTGDQIKFSKWRIGNDIVRENTEISLRDLFIS